MRKQDYYEPSIGRESEPRRRPKKKKKRANRGERVVVTLLSLLFLTVAIVATVKYVVRAPEPVTDNEDQQTQQDGTAEDSDAIQTISNGKERKKYCYTILAYGVDNDAGGSDTNMLVRFDAENKKIDVVSLPRDTLMSNGHKLNSSYNNGGTEKLRSNIEDMLGIPVDFYVSVDLKGFIALIDQIGGVDFDVPEDMDYDDPLPRSAHSLQGRSPAPERPAVLWRSCASATTPTRITPATAGGRISAASARSRRFEDCGAEADED